MRPGRCYPGAGCACWQCSQPHLCAVMRSSSAAMMAPSRSSPIPTGGSRPVRKQRQAVRRQHQAVSGSMQAGRPSVADSFFHAWQIASTVRPLLTCGPPIRAWARTHLERCWPPPLLPARPTPASAPPAAAAAAAAVGAAAGSSAPQGPEGQAASWRLLAPAAVLPAPPAAGRHRAGDLPSLLRHRLPPSGLAGGC